MPAQAAYNELIRRAREQSLLASCAEVLGWDEETHMPPGGADHRSHQLALLAGLQHAREADPRMGELLAELEGSPLVGDAHSAEAVNVRELRRRYDRSTRLPRPLVEELARITSLAQQEWVAARRHSDFGRFRPWLEKVVVLKRHEGEALGRGTVYDALLEEYEPGASSRELGRLFDTLQRELVPLAGAIRERGRRTESALLDREYPIARQRAFAKAVAAALGFDFERGRLDTTVHPFFSSIGPGDCRLTTRYRRRHFSDGFFGMLHELGHGLYEQGLDPEHYGTPMGEAVSLGVHESQARLWENNVGRSRPFWGHFLPAARRAFPGALRGVSLDRFYGAVNHVEPSVNRVRADEVTYNLHILVRFELEQALMAGDLKAADVPAAWNEAYRGYLGVVPKNDAEGCLQDGHWGAGLIGYFPTYTLGNVFAAQLFARAGAELDNLDEEFARGNFAGLLHWLRERVYRPGHRYPAAELIERVTGSGPDPRFLVEALKRKYGELYGI